MNDALDLSQAVDLQAVMNKAASDKAKQLPKPSGYRILCAIPEAEESYESGIIKSDDEETPHYFEVSYLP